MDRHPLHRNKQDWRDLATWTIVWIIIYGGGTAAATKLLEVIL